MSKFGTKWKMVKTIFSSNNCVLIYEAKESKIKQLSFSNMMMYEKLAERLVTFVKKWREQWNKMSQYVEPEVPEV